MAKLREHGYRTVSLAEVVHCLVQRTPLPSRSFVITFDDGYRSVYEEAFPVLRDCGFSATIFLTVGQEKTSHASARLPSMEGRTMLSWGEIRDMQRSGIGFGAHTLTHPDLTQLPADQIEAEVCGSKTILEEALGAPVTGFAYPYGYHDEQSRDIVRRHFGCACSTRLGLVTARSDPYTLERVEMYYFRSERLFDLMLSSLFPWYLRARSIPRAIRQTIRRGLG
jgi:peptidoglycan/xylan/chitin deacetylase (PgdA/CDA1 family)